MPPRLGLHTNRLRANSFGGIARAYDAHRPMYPDQLIDDLMVPKPAKVLDVGAGTGHASEQFSCRGVSVLAVEPDERMSTIARQKGLSVEGATFEAWDPAGRQFDLVVFAASFHWVDPAVALPKIRGLLTPGGRLALIWNRLMPIEPSSDDFNAIYRDYMDTRNRPSTDESNGVQALIEASGYAVNCRTYQHHFTYLRDEWLDLVFTYSDHLTISTEQAAELRQRLSDRIGPQGVRVGGDALAVIATPQVAKS